MLYLYDLNGKSLTISKLLIINSTNNFVYYSNVVFDLYERSHCQTWCLLWLKKCFTFRLLSNAQKHAETKEYTEKT
jgi:hypothetical protein